MLLSRDNFRESVFKRDGYKCVLCKEEAQDAHHVLERRLFPDGGYYLDNGASVCGPCHIKAEETAVSCEEIREAAGIHKVVLPPHLEEDQRYDKWGNPILPNGTRLRGELFYDESVQKILAPILTIFTDRVKYPRTFHLPWSEGRSSDDKVMRNVPWVGDEVVVTEKMDGENTSMYYNYVHARSLDYANHVSRNRIKALHASIAGDIPYGWRICGENLTAKHSIHYQNLPSFFMVFSIWNEKNECLSWEDTVVYSSLLNLQTVPVLYEGVWDEDLVKALYTPSDRCEGYVVRPKGAFSYSEFKNKVGKFVRKGHVQTSSHWLHEEMVENKGF